MAYRCRYVNWSGESCDWRGQELKELKQHVAQVHKGFVDRDSTTRKPTRPVNPGSHHQRYNPPSPPRGRRRSRSPQKQQREFSRRTPSSPRGRSGRPSSPQRTSPSDTSPKSRSIRQRNRPIDAACQTNKKRVSDKAIQVEEPNQSEEDELFNTARNLRHAERGCKSIHKTKHIIPPGVKITYHHETLHLPDGTVYTRITKEEKRKDIEKKDD
ncbi:uncharacterized protein LOC135157906 [Lytechinus pictus]|uniref:uncharacterized protein LOC135157906 n=1 Tax=Lytechinus pictus TaxID=7653 RepID=UPI0030BA26CC